MTLVLSILVSLGLTGLVWKASSSLARSRNLILLGTAMGALFCTACGFNNAVEMIDSMIPVIAGIIPMVAAAASVILPTESTLITDAATGVVDGLNALKKVLDNYESNPGTNTLSDVTNAVNAVQANVTQLETAAKVKDPTMASKLASIVSGAQVELAAVESWIYSKHDKLVQSKGAAVNS